MASTVRSARRSASTVSARAAPASLAKGRASKSRRDWRKLVPLARGALIFVVAYPRLKAPARGAMAVQTDPSAGKRTLSSLIRCRVQFKLLLQLFPKPSAQVHSRVAFEHYLISAIPIELQPADSL